MEMEWESVNWIHMAEEEDMWWSVMSMVMKDGEFLD
jgi:hypothetical protein